MLKINVFLQSDICFFLHSQQNAVYLFVYLALYAIFLYY